MKRPWVQGAAMHKEVLTGCEAKCEHDRIRLERFNLVSRADPADDNVSPSRIVQMER
jgi:hypothetical protein